MNTSVQPVRVLQIVQNLNYGGMERLIAEIATRADPERFELHIMALQFLGRFAEGLPPYVKLHQGPPMSRWSNLRPRALAQQIRNISPDVVHSHSGVWLKAGLAARLAGVRRVIHTEHGRQHPDPLEDRVISRIASRYSDVVVAVSEPLGEYIERTIVAKGRPVQVISNGVDTSRLVPCSPPGPLHSELGLSPDTAIIGSIGRLEPVKGYDFMVRAFCILLRELKPAHDVVLVIAGDGSERPAIEQMVLESGLGDRIFLLGWRDAVQDLHHSFHLFTMSSHSEGTSVSLLEAMSGGVCPVVTNVGGNAHVLGSALAHRLVPPADPGSLAQAWHDALVRDPERRQADAQHARLRTVQHFDVATMVRAYESLYAAEVTATDCASNRVQP